ncbi:MAG: CBS domain-containing protein [Acidimicrobiales bacterium]
MSSPAVVLFPEMSLKEAGSVLTGHRISGAPVVDKARKLVGMLSEGDILGARAEGVTPPTVGDAMTTEVICVDEGTDLKVVTLRILDAHVHRVPVLGGERVVGVISRHDLLKQLARSDATLEVDVANLLGQEGTALGHIEVDVKDGVARLHGQASRSTLELAVKLAQTVPGIVGAGLRTGEPLPDPAWVLQRQ